MGIPYDVAEQLLIHYMLLLVSSLGSVLVTALGFHMLGWRYLYLGTGIAVYVVWTT